MRRIVAPVVAGFQTWAVSNWGPTIARVQRAKADVAACSSVFLVEDP
jgi:hypothetical protein